MSDNTNYASELGSSNSSLTDSNTSTGLVWAIGLLFLVMVAAGGGWLGAYVSQLQLELLEVERRSVETQSELRSLILNLEFARSDLEEANENLRQSLAYEQELVDELSEELEVMTGEVREVRRLQEIDPELLRKYSRVYFLSDNYKPGGLVELPERYLAPQREEVQFHEEAWPFLRDLLEAAERDGIDMEVVSGYRSFEEQGELKDRYLVTYGQGANQFSADQGYSEHQLGTAVDLSVPELNGALRGFEQTKAYQWLKDNAHRFGFILSYPEDNPNYIFEPWHWRFVGIELATDLYRRGEYFYDMDQREIDEYRINLFDR